MRVQTADGYLVPPTIGRRVRRSIPDPWKSIRGKRSAGTDPRGAICGRAFVQKVRRMPVSGGSDTDRDTAVRSTKLHI
jgi:hypothetical protein